MAHGKEVHLDDNIQIGDEATDFGKKVLGAGVVLTVVGLAIAGGPFTRQGAASYLVAYMYVLAIGLGSLWFVTIQHLTNAKWSVVVRRGAGVPGAHQPGLAPL